MCGSASDRMRACSCGSILALAVMGSSRAAVFSVPVLADIPAARERSKRRLGADIMRGRADHPAGLPLFERMGEPADTACGGEYLGEGIARYADGFQQQRRVHL